MIERIQVVWEGRMTVRGGPDDGQRRVRIFPLDSLSPILWNVPVSRIESAISRVRCYESVPFPI